VAALFVRYMQGFDIAQVMTLEEVRHQFLSGQGDSRKEKEDGGWGTWRESQVTWSYVIEAS